ncbi:MAG: zinc ribbon domain-containing protein [Methanothrix sp.]
MHAGTDVKNTYEHNSISVLGRTGCIRVATYSGHCFYPRCTSQRCSGCGIMSKALNDRVNECLRCGIKLDRDHNGE